MFRMRAERVSERHFPRNNGRRVFRRSAHSLRGAGEGAMTARTAVAGEGTVARCLQAQHSPWPAPGAVPILDMIELRDPGAYLLLRGLVVP